MITDKQSSNQFKNRRRMAWLSFILMAIVGIAVMIFGLSSDSAAARVDSMTWMFTGLFGVWTTIILAYFGANSIAEVWSSNNE